MREYTVDRRRAAVVGVVALERLVLHTGLLRTRAYWIAMAICYGFMIAVNGWLTKLSAPIVHLRPARDDRLARSRGTSRSRTISSGSRC